MYRGLVTGLLTVTTVLIAVAVWAFFATKPRRTTTEEAASQTRQLIFRAGGSVRICDEAAILFARFGSTKLKFLHPEDLQDCPAIKGLGKADGIWPGDPPYIKIRIGNHIKGFQIDIVDLKPDSNGAGPAGAAHIEGCVYVQR